MTAPHTISSRRAVSARRSQLAEEFAASMKALKRGMEAGIPADLRGEFGGVTTHQLEALVCLMSSEGGISMNDLSRALGVGMSSCTALADRLIRNGLAERGDDPADRRVVRLMPTARARDTVERFQAARRRRFLELLDALEDEEVATLTRLVSAMVASAAEPARP